MSYYEGKKSKLIEIFKKLPKEDVHYLLLEVIEDDDRPNWTINVMKDAIKEVIDKR